MTFLEEKQLDFINLRFGTFIHFNSASVQFHASDDVIDWEYDVENGGACRRYPFDERAWAPAEANPDVWAQAAKAAGCRFAALTAKHHEGFCLWPTAATPHSVASATVKTDLVAAYLASFRKAGIAAGLYFSILDLTQGISRHRPFDGAAWDFVKQQVTELLTNYGPIPFLMVDGWGAPWGGPTYEALPFAKLDALVKSLQPDCLLLNIGCSDSLAGSDAVFYENAAGQEVDDGFMGPGVSCNKLTPTWFHRDEDRLTAPASVAWAVKKAKGYFAKNVNFMLNLSPDENGKLDASLIERFEEIGRSLVLPPPLSGLPAGWLKR